MLKVYTSHDAILAQSVVHHIGSVEVAGSIPANSLLKNGFFLKESVFFVYQKTGGLKSHSDFKPPEYFISRQFL